MENIGLRSWQYRASAVKSVQKTSESQYFLVRLKQAALVSNYYIALFNFRKPKNRRLMTVSMETVSMAKSLIYLR